MKEISLKTTLKELIELGADETSKELVLNNVRLYNDLIGQYHDGNMKNLYLTYQLNVQIGKQIIELRKLNKKGGEDDDDDLKSLIKSIKKPETR